MSKQAVYYAVWYGRREIAALLFTTTRSLAKAQRIVAAMAKAGQAAYITREQGCLMHEPTGEVVNGIG